VIKSIKMRWARPVARMEEVGAYRILMRMPVRRRPHERPTYRWEYNIKIFLQEIGWGPKLD
jgi:hypothetical protein